MLLYESMAYAVGYSLGIFIQGSLPVNQAKTALYIRVSTANQTADNQLHELERVAAARGWNIVATYRDDGISGAKSRDQWSWS
jgi:predicted site-specific integrase-resolvase